LEGWKRVQEEDARAEAPRHPNGVAKLDDDALSISNEKLHSVAAEGLARS
jgi:hypothetical protein